MNLTPMRFQGKSIAKSYEFACRWWEKQTVLYSKILLSGKTQKSINILPEAQ